MLKEQNIFVYEVKCYEKYMESLKPILLNIQKHDNTYESI